jgi:hypothetical protein
VLEELLHTLQIQCLVWIHLGINTLEVGLRENSGGTMSRSRDKQSIKIVLLDQTVEVHICEDLTWGRAKVAKQSKLEVLRLERFSEKRVILEIDHTQGEVATSLEEVIV